MSFYIDDFQLSYVPPPMIQSDIPSIFETLSGYFPVGAAVDPSDLSGPHAQLLTKHFNSITSGNDMKWSSVEPTKGTFNFTNADAQAGEAVCNNMRIRGHNLVWATGAQTPSYAFGDGTNSAANQAVVTANIQEHIQNEVQHFGSKVYAWDVVNEPLDPSQPDCLVHGPFYNVLGKSYIDVALAGGAAVCSGGHEAVHQRLQHRRSQSPGLPGAGGRGLALARDSPRWRRPRDAQRASTTRLRQAMVNAIETVHENFPDIEQQVTELDMSVYNAGDITSNYGPNIPPSVLAEQGWLYKSYFDAFRQLKGKLSAVTFWGMADDDTWLDGFPVARTDYPAALRSRACRPSRPTGALSMKPNCPATE